MKVDSTVEIVEKIAERLRDYAEDIDRIAIKMKENSDLDYAGEVINCIANMFNNLRLDLLATRPIRELKREIVVLEDKIENQMTIK